MIEIKDLDTALNVGKKIMQENLVPIIKLSNVDGSNLENFKKLLNILPVPYDMPKKGRKEVEVPNFHFLINLC